MTTKTLSGQYASTYQLTSPVTTLSITAAGYLGGGLTAAGTGGYTVVNNGQIDGALYGASFAGKGFLTNAGTIVNRSTYAGSGVAFVAGGQVANAAGALIEGYYGVRLGSSASTVTNHGQIIGFQRFGVKLEAGGTVVNGGTSDTAALIRGSYAVVAELPAVVDNFGVLVGVSMFGGGAYFTAGGYLVNGANNDRAATIVAGKFGVAVESAAGTVVNFGLIRATGTSAIGVQLTAGGSVTNGSAADTSARIDAFDAVQILSQAGAVMNFGVIYSAVYDAVYLGAGGAVTNGTTLDTSAQIAGLTGVHAKAVAATVDNFATIGGASTSLGVNLESGGSVTNGAAGDLTALVEGYSGILGGAALTLANWGTIDGDGPAAEPHAGFFGVEAANGGRITNGGTADLTAMIESQIGVAVTGAPATVTNFATILGSQNAVVLETASTSFTNGSKTDTSALIHGGHYGVFINGTTATATNFATIQADLGLGEAVYVGCPATFNNGASGAPAVLIEGRFGLRLNNTDKGFNWGTIAGRSTNGGIGAYIRFHSVLTNEAGALISGYDGAVVGAYSTLINFGTITAAGGTAAQILQPNAMIKTEAGSVFGGRVIASAGTVDAVGGVTAMKGLESEGSVIGAGTITLNGGSSLFVNGASLTVAEIAVAGGATLVEVSAPITDAKLWVQSAGTLQVDAGHELAFTGTGDSFSGTLTGAGTIAFTGGTDAFANVHLSASSMVVNGASASLSGTINLSQSLTVTSTSMVVAAAGATLVGGGTLTLTNKASNLITGASAAATLTNFDRITGAGQFGGGAMVIANKGGGVINANVSTRLVIDTGTNTVTNAGLIESTSTGGLLISSPIANTGTLTVTNGTLEAAGAVTGTGSVKIGGGVADFAAAFSENVTFTSTTGMLELARATAYTGKVTGFSKTGTTSLDLLDIASATAKANYSGTTTSGVLTVTDGTHMAKIHLTGNYTASTFTTSSDGHGGTKVVDPTAQPSHTPPMLPLVTAMAEFGTRSGATAVMPGFAAAPQIARLVHAA